MGEAAAATATAPSAPPAPPAGPPPASHHCGPTPATGACWERSGGLREKAADFQSTSWTVWTLEETTGHRLGRLRPLMMMSSQG